MHTTIVRSWGAIALGCICALGTATVLFWHVRSLADITTNHVMIGLALIVTLGAGHFMWSSAELSLTGAVRFVSFVVLFVAGTAVCVSLSAGRSAETVLRNEYGASHFNEQRAKQLVRIAEAEADVKKAKANADAFELDAKLATQKMADECDTGKGTRCQGKRFAAEVAVENAATAHKLARQAESHHAMMLKELASLKPQQVANADLKQLAKVVAFLGRLDELNALPMVETFWAYALALITEFGTVAFFNYGFGHGRRQVPVGASWWERVRSYLPQKQLMLPAPTVAASPVVSTPPVSHPQVSVPTVSGKPTKPEKVKRQRPTDVQMVFQALESLGGQADSQDQLADVMQISKGEASKRVDACGQYLLVERVGRCHVIRPNYNV